MAKSGTISEVRELKYNSLTNWPSDEETLIINYDDEVLLRRTVNWERVIPSGTVTNKFRFRGIAFSLTASPKANEPEVITVRGEVIK